MPRQARVIIPNTPHHIVQRGHNRQVVFTSDDDFSFYKENLTHYKEEFGCKVYAYCFMSNHVHLLIDPKTKRGQIYLIIPDVGTTRFWGTEFNSVPIRKYIENKSVPFLNLSPF